MFLYCTLPSFACTFEIFDFSLLQLFCIVFISLDTRTNNELAEECGSVVICKTPYFQYEHQHTQLAECQHL